MGIRIGQGIDVHRFSSDRELVLGGVKIPFAKGLEGHSDADVLLHALTDSLLGAAGMGDIGCQFPDSESQWKNANSLNLLKIAWDKIHKKGGRLLNIDCTLLAEHPKISPYLSQMKANIAEVLKIGVNQIGIKATTAERLGFIGREEGIAAFAVCLIEID